MRRIVLGIVLLLFMVIPVSAAEITAPPVPDEGEIYMPEAPQTFGEGLLYVLQKSLSAVAPEFAEAAGICCSVIGAGLICSIVSQFTGQGKNLVDLSSTLLIGILLIQPANSLVGLGRETITTLSEYGKLLVPVLTTALAAQGAVETSAALYAATSLFSTLLNSLISHLLVPMLYVYLCLCIACSAVDEEILKKLRDFVKWLATWSLKILIYVFTGYMTVSGVISGSADATAIKATKLAISSMIPVVGGMLSDASETVLVSAGLVRSSVGTYGLLAIISLWIGPFLKIGAQYLLLKITSVVLGSFSGKRASNLLSGFSGAMGLLLGMIGVQSLLLIISTVCFMRGVG